MLPAGLERFGQWHPFSPARLIRSLNAPRIGFTVIFIKLFLPQRREGRRDVFSYSLPLIPQKYRRTGRAAKNERALLLKIIGVLDMLQL
jgi:hypothetical protein